MSYQSGFRITAANLNQFYANVGGLYGVGVGDIGYGQTALASVSPLTAATPVSASHVEGLFALVTACANHQGLLQNPTFGITPTTGVAATASPSLTDTIDGLFTNRFLVASAVTTPGVLTTSISTPWTRTIATTFTAAFPSEDAARYFFNCRLQNQHPVRSSQRHNWAG